MRILIADDSNLIVSRLHDSLSALDNLEIVGVANDGTLALSMARNLKPDMAILDLMMPGLNGLQVLSEIRKKDKKMVIMILTYYLTDDYRNKAVEYGADYVFSKVDDFENVSVIVGELMENYKNK
jgi:two-component system response regulator (stage 0 sporulation protein A)